MQLVAHSRRRSGLSVVCGCIHGCTLSVLSDFMLQVGRPYHALHPSLHEGCKIQLFNYCTDPVGNNHSFTAIYTQ